MYLLNILSNLAQFSGPKEKAEFWVQLDELEYESLLKVVEDRIDFELEKVECESANDELCAELNSELVSELKTLGMLLDDWKLPKTAIKWNNSSTDVLKQPNSIHSVKNFLIDKHFSTETIKPCNPFRMINRRTDSTVGFVQWHQ